MRSVKRPRAPKILTAHDSPGKLETAAAIAWHEDPANDGATYGKFQAYSRDEVKQALMVAFANKCAYCETLLAGQPVDVEHYRPKGAVRTDAALLPRGYFWLAATWSNLLPSCIDCNRARKHDFGDGRPTLGGKANLFPIADESRRATRPKQERREQPLLLHPYDDQPEKHLEFTDDGAVRPRPARDGTPSAKGEATIVTTALQRPILREARRNHLTAVRAQIKVMQLAQRLLEADPRDPTAREDYRTAVRDLAELVHPSKPYSAMAKQYVDVVRPR